MHNYRQVYNALPVKRKEKNKYLLLIISPFMFNNSWAVEDLFECMKCHPCIPQICMFCHTLTIIHIFSLKTTQVELHYCDDQDYGNIIIR